MATYLVTQATGQQSQLVITYLLAAGASVHAVVRDPQKKLPPVLERPGVTVFKGESDNFESIFQAAQGCRGVFLNTFPIPGLEAKQAKTVVEACKKAGGVETIVASTTMRTGNRALWDNAAAEEIGLRGYYQSKTEVEDAVRAAGLKAYTILRPGFIHFDYLLPSAAHNYPDLPVTGELVHAFDDGTKLIHTDAHDVGKYVAAALQDPAKFGGQEIELGGEALTVEEARDILARVSGRNVRVRKRTAEEVEEAKATVFAQRFQLLANVSDFNSVVAAAEVQAKYGMPFTSLEESMQRDKDRLLQCLPSHI